MKRIEPSPALWTPKVLRVTLLTRMTELSNITKRNSDTMVLLDDVIAPAVVAVRYGDAFNKETTPLD
uniref:Uncharacterized protein n=1 Tax=Vespula pensylvanica TaxID=30213 RepID=A0A834NXR2_VESPE|nr:hypothetical protein H0235_010795 [Vespula pensylvanica]